MAGVAIADHWPSGNLLKQLLEFLDRAQTSGPRLDGSAVVQVDGAWQVTGAHDLRALLAPVKLSL